eukprot:NODE_157_length_15108_cov_0.423079.p11 type:complete len:144 gc:universal NODE_157_length_15108_cov_0.423079:5417-5848(+)
MFIIIVENFNLGMTLLLCLFELQGRPPVSWVIVYLNLAVHVVMYFYYFLAALKIKVWWKMAVTILQIVQFVIDLMFVYGCSSILILQYFHLTDIQCAGTTFAAVFGCSLLTSYLFLFVLFFGKTYKSKKETSTGKSNKTKKNK